MSLLGSKMKAAAQAHGAARAPARPAGSKASRTAVYASYVHYESLKRRVESLPPILPEEGASCRFSEGGLPNGCLSSPATPVPPAEAGRTNERAIEAVVTRALLGD